MKRICQRCNVISQDFNLWCQEKYCPAENATEIFDNGEWFGPIEIVQPIVITRSAIVYQAHRGEEQILLKVANVGCEEKLRLEAKAFLQLAKAGQHPLLPVLLPAHPQGTIDYHPYGWTVIEGRVKYFEVFKFVDGTILRNLLLKNSQPWYQHVGWIILSIADCVCLPAQGRQAPPVHQPRRGAGAVRQAGHSRGQSCSTSAWLTLATPSMNYGTKTTTCRPTPPLRSPMGAAAWVPPRTSMGWGLCCMKCWQAIRPMNTTSKRTRRF